MFGLISYLVWLTLAIFVLTIVISYYNKLKKKKMASELNTKVDSYLKQHSSNIEVEYADSEDYKIVGHPELHVLRVVELDNITSIYFSNNGSSIFNIDVHSSDVPNISIEPKDSIPNKSSGCIKFSFNNIADNKITFLLNYSDERMNKVSKKYLFLITDKEVKEIF